MISKSNKSSSLLKPVGAIALAFFALLLPACQPGVEEPYEEREEGVIEEEDLEEEEGVVEEED
jgi:hypothetical protein